MAPYLFTVSIGPVQDFIRAARRTRDFWAGSEILSEISRSVALELEKTGELIFPGDSPSSQDRQISNVLLAQVDHDDPANLAKHLRELAVRQLARQGRDALEEIRKRGGGGSFANEPLFHDQLADQLEFFSAWAAFPEGADYKVTRRKVANLLAARKNCRQFSQSEQTAMQIPKSSLDGNRETVILETAPRPDPDRPTTSQLQRDLRLTAGEELDAIGLTKRMHRVQYYPSISRIAVEPWVADKRKDLTELRQHCDRISPLHLTSHDWDRFDRFRYEGSILFRERHRELRLFLDQVATDAIDAVAEILKADKKKWGAPQPYIAILQADGDRMGQAISHLMSRQAHQDFSKKLAGFAASVKMIVEEKSQGCLIYAGADDVLAMLPLHTALTAAQTIRDSFMSHMKPINDTIPADEQCTLSVGLGIGHFLEPMEDLLEIGAAAEKQAKTAGRNRLCVTLSPRGGTNVTFMNHWDSKWPIGSANSPVPPEGPVGQLLSYTQWHLDGAISDKSIYGLASLLPIYREREAGDWPGAINALKFDAKRLLDRKVSANPDLARSVSQILRCIDAAESLADIECTVYGLQIARRLKVAFEQSGRSAWPATQEFA